MYPRVAVLLAAYNGLKYIKEQLECIFSQQGVITHVYISVDTSDDGTEEYVSTLTKNRNDVTQLSSGIKFGGAAKNFFHLLTQVDFTEYDYISLADQDDIWELNKLSKGIEKLRENNASGYSSNVMAFWEDGRRTLINKAQPQVEYDYLFEAAGPGCTYILDVKLANEIKCFINKNSEAVSVIDLHDWFIYAYARSHNHVWFIDTYPGMQYRQHGNNQVGANNSLRAAVKRLSLIKNKWYRTQIIKIANVLELNYQPFLQRTIFNGYMGNIYMLFNLHRIRRRLRDRIALSIACVFGLF